MNNRIEMKVGRFTVAVTFENWKGVNDVRSFTPEIIEEIKLLMSEGNLDGDMLADVHCWNEPITWEAEFDPNTITSEEEDVILGEIIDENPKEMLQVAGVYSLVREYFNNDIISRAEANEMHKLMAGRGDYGNKD